MKTGRVIQMAAGKRLEPIGFTYQGGSSDPWLFVKDNGEMQIVIGISKYRFDRNMITFHMDASESGVPAVSADQICFGCGNTYMPGYWKYENIAELETVLDEMLSFILDHLEELISYFEKARSFRITNEMNERLMNDHQQFLDSYEIEETGKEVSESLCMKLYEAVKSIHRAAEETERIICIAAWTGELYRRRIHGRWEYMVLGKMKDCCICMNEAEVKMIPLRFVKNVYLDEVTEQMFKKTLTGASESR